MPGNNLLQFADEPAGSLNMQDSILTVRQLTEKLRKNLEGRFPFVWVRGEVSNLSRPQSGNIYFSLKDQDAQLQCVWFLNQQRHLRQGQIFDPLTGEIFDAPKPAPSDILRDGLTMLCAGRISVYAARGQYQLIVELAQEAGQGLLAQAFEARKRKLAMLGYFALERKRPLPYDPKRIALITSPSGAALHDFLRLGKDRGTGAQIRLFPSLVQGDAAVSEIVAALHLADAQNWAQVAVLIRGGGSLEDLWAFNEEPVVDAVFRSRIPVLAGIGHEVDVTLTDLTADVRAATPSHAAQMLWPLRAELLQRLDEANAGLHQATTNFLNIAGRCLHEQEKALHWLSPARYHVRLVERLAGLSLSLEHAIRQWLMSKQHAFEKLETARQGASSPQKLMGSAGHLNLLISALHRAFARVLSNAESDLAVQLHLLRINISTLLENRINMYNYLTLALKVCNPSAPLVRGYALAFTSEGDILRSIKQTMTGREIDVRLGDGRLTAVVRAVKPR